MCYWKQWRKTKTKVRNLLKLGTFIKIIVEHCYGFLFIHSYFLQMF